MAKKDKFAEKHQDRETKSFDELFAEYGQIIRELEYGEVTEELEARLIANKENFEDKLAGIYHVICDMQSKTKGYLKDNIQSLSSRIKRYEKQIDFLKARAMMIVEEFGYDNKLITEKVNCSIVSLDILETDEDYDRRLEHLKECIKFNAVAEEITDDENTYLGANISISNMSCELAAKVYKIISENSDVINEFPDIQLNITSDRKGILEALKVNRELNSGKKAQYAEAKKLAEEIGGELTFGEPTETVFEIPGVSIGTSKYPKFS